MTDVFEIVHQLNPHVFDDSVGDNDSDGLLNFEEALQHTSPRLADTHDDPDEVLLADGNSRNGTDFEARFGALNANPAPFDVMVRLSPSDWDADTMPDSWEHRYGFSSAAIRSASNTSDDPDNDGLTNLEEYQLGTNPIIPDEDQNGVRDGDDDWDGDGLSNAWEQSLGTNPRMVDSDGDGESDRDEVNAGTNPLDRTSCTITPWTKVSITDSPRLRLRHVANTPDGAVIGASVDLCTTELYRRQVGGRTDEATKVIYNGPAQGAKLVFTGSGVQECSGETDENGVFQLALPLTSPTRVEVSVSVEGTGLSSFIEVRSLAEDFTPEIPSSVGWAHTTTRGYVTVDVSSDGITDPYGNYFLDRGHTADVFADVRQKAWEIWTHRSGATETRNFRIGPAGGANVQFFGASAPSQIADENGRATARFTMPETSAGFLTVRATYPNLPTGTGFFLFYPTTTSSGQPIQWETTDLRESLEVSLQQMGPGVVALVERTATVMYVAQNDTMIPNLPGATTKGPVQGAWVWFYMGDAPDTLEFQFPTHAMTNQEGITAVPVDVDQVKFVKVRASYNSAEASTTIPIRPPFIPDNPFWGSELQSDTVAHLMACTPEPDAAGTYKCRLIVDLVNLVNDPSELVGTFSIQKGGGSSSAFSPKTIDFSTLPTLPEATLTGLTREAIQNGITVQVDIADQSGHYLDSATDDVPPLPSEIIVDANRDGKLDDTDRGLITSDHPWRFWINDDNDSGDTVGDDIPVGETSSSNARLSSLGVDGTRDLIDFFPVWLDIKGMLVTLPPNDYEYRLVCDDGAVNFVYTDLTRDQALSYLTDVAQAEKLAHTIAYPTGSGTGVALQSSFLEQVRTNPEKAVLLVEGRVAGKNTLRLDVWKDGEIKAAALLPLSLSCVEKMYRHLNILAANDQPEDGLETTLGQPDNLPDSDCSDKNFVFVHGYNVNPTQARGWFAEMFKRLWCSGSRAKFTGVTWYGYETQGAIPLLPDVTPDYQANVLNAFASASALKDELQALQGPITIAAHSLGNMLVGSAIQDWGFHPAKYFMIDAAVAKECYDETEDQTNIMSDPFWENYPPIMRSSEWHRLPWEEGDWRTKLTWGGRLEGVTNVHNFYSTGEEVLQNPEHGPAPMISGATGIWANQEKRKGLGLTGRIYSSRYGGWDKNRHPSYRTTDYDPEYGIPSERMKTRSELESQFGDLESESFQDWLKTTPFFETGFDPVTNQVDADAPSDIQNLYGANGSAYASPEQNRNRLLAEMIPARSTAAGSNPIPGINGFDMNDERMKNGWPASRPPGSGWWHSDLRNVAYLYTHKVFDKFVSEGELNK